MVHELVRDLGKSQPLISQHLRVLRQSGLVTATRQGREVVYSLAKPNIVGIIYDLAATLDEAQDDLARLRNAKQDANGAAQHRIAENKHAAAGAAIIEPPAAVRPELDPGLYPTTPKPERT